jgi:hypothetical protein
VLSLADGYGFGSWATSHPPPSPDPAPVAVGEELSIVAPSGIRDALRALLSKLSERSDDRHLKASLEQRQIRRQRLREKAPA